MNFIVCIATTNFGDFSAEDLTVGRLYEVVNAADEHGMMRIIDDSGDDYLYPVDLFEPVHLPANVAARVCAALRK